MPSRPGWRVKRRRSWSWARRCSGPSGSAASRQWSQSRDQSSKRDRAASSTRRASPSGKWSPARGWPARLVRVRTWAGERSPAWKADLVAGMVRSRRASRTSPATCGRGSLARTAIQSMADREPSSAHTRRASKAAVNSATAAARRACWRRRPTMAAASSLSPMPSGSSATNSSTAATSASVTWPASPRGPRSRRARRADGVWRRAASDVSVIEHVSHRIDDYDNQRPSGSTRWRRAADPLRRHHRR